MLALPRRHSDSHILWLTKIFLLIFFPLLAPVNLTNWVNYMSKLNLSLIWIYQPGNDTLILKCLYKSQSMDFNKRTFYDRAVPAPAASSSSSKKIHGCRRPFTWKLAFGCGKATHTSKSPFHLINFLDTTMGYLLSYLAKTGRLNPTPTGKTLGLLDSGAEGKHCF